MRYRDRTAAELALAKVRHTDRGSRPKLERRAYRCPRCRGWHLTTPRRARLATSGDSTLHQPLAPPTKAPGDAHVDVAVADRYLTPQVAESERAVGFVTCDGIGLLSVTCEVNRTGGSPERYLSLID